MHRNAQFHFLPSLFSLASLGSSHGSFIFAFFLGLVAIRAENRPTVLFYIRPPASPSQTELMEA